MPMAESCSPLLGRDYVPLPRLAARVVLASPHGENLDVAASSVALRSAWHGLVACPWASPAMAPIFKNVRRESRRHARMVKEVRAAKAMEVA